MMTIDQIFKALPRDLQWEILSEFAGTHVVRNGKLMRKLTMTIPHQTLKHHIFHISPKYPWHYSKYGTISTNFEIPCFLSEAVNIVSQVTLSDDGYQIMYCEGAVKRNMSYIIFRTATKIIDGRGMWDDERFLIDDSVVLEPFIKHEFSSYPFTNKKMGRKS
jgi:hypothetical protein